MNAIETVKDWMENGVGDDPPGDAIGELVKQHDALVETLEEFVSVIDECLKPGQWERKLEKVALVHGKARAALRQAGR